MQAIMVLVAVPLLILNLGGLVGGIGLAVQGEWRLVIGGIGWILIGPFALSVAMLPGMIFAPLGMWAAERGNAFAAMVAAIPTLIWTYVVVTVSCILVFRTVVARPDAGFFHLVWGYCLATAPWSYMANKDRKAGNDAATTLMFFVQLGTVAMMVASWSDPASMDIRALGVWFVPFMVLGLCTQVVAAWDEARSARYRAR